MENVKNEGGSNVGSQAEKSHQCSVCHSNCHMKMWGGHSFSIKRVIIGVSLIVIAFCLGAGAGGDGHHREGRGGHRSEYGRHMESRGKFGGRGAYGQQMPMYINSSAGIESGQQNVIYYRAQAPRQAGGMPMMQMMSTTTTVK